MTSAADSAATTPTIRIARCGTFVSNEGVSVTFGEAELAAAASAYNATRDPAPLVIGHPALDDPAYGWVDDLRVEDGALVASASRIEPSFAELVREGRYAKVSARFYPPRHPANPAPGAWYLKHVGFLGAHAPGIKGLGTVAFAEGDADPADVVTIDFAEDDAPASTPANEEEPMSKPDPALALDERAAQLDQREQAIAAREAAAEKAAADARHAENVSFAEGLVNDVKLAPAGKALVVGLLDHLDATAAVSFGEAGDLTPAAAFRQLLSGGAPIVSLGEVGGKPAGDDKSYTSFAAPAGYEVDPARAELYAKAKAIQDKNPELDWMAAVVRAQQAG